MHHYGEDAVGVYVSEAGFMIELRNHETGAAVMITGPVRGVFEDPERVMDHDAAFFIGRQLAHVLREVTGGAAMEA